MYGGTVVRPLFYEFPKDLETHDLGHQFLWGSSMLVAPVLHQGATSVNVYLPENDWYSLFDYNYGQLMQHGYQEYPTPWTSQIPVFVRGEDSVAGDLYWDDGESIIESYDMHDYYYWSFKYYADSQNGYLSIKTERRAVNINVQTSSYNPYKSILYVSTKNLIDISGEGSANLSWKHSTGDNGMGSNGKDLWYWNCFFIVICITGYM
ncbi:hypothetical protein OSTOST_02848 [Ostertagia ostertagi]